MRLEAIQNALFAAYDIQKTLTPKQLASPIAEASFDETVGSNLQDIIDTLTAIELEMLSEEDAA